MCHLSLSMLLKRKKRVFPSKQTAWTCAQTLPCTCRCRPHRRLLLHHAASMQLSPTLGRAAVWYGTTGPADIDAPQTKNNTGASSPKGNA